MAKLSNYISVLSDFQFSINLEYDLYSDQKIRNYIPTMSAIDLIEDVMLSTAPKSTDRARIFIGAYGKGKSHLALMLLALMSRKDKSLYKDLLEMICQSKPELCNYINEYQNSNQRLLPVIIQGSSVGIRQAFLLGLKKALQTAGLDYIMPDTYFGAALNTIKIWKEKYPETFNKFKELIPNSIQEFEAELAEFNHRYYEKFIQLYPELTSGSEFNPVNGLNIVELYSDVNQKIRACGYTGIFVVYDEFSKFLSGNLNNTSSDEVEILQYFAEACNRSENNQMHILLISHQSILNYVDKLSKNKVNSWKTVSQRFKAVELNTSPAQMYDITARVIKKAEEWYDDFLEHPQVRVVFEEMYSKWKDKRIFSDLTDEQYRNLVYGCYPLEPITAFMLPQISEKIAQNERTLFTFLSSNGQKNTLPYFLDRTNLQGVPFITPDYIFDYFAPLFKVDSYDRLTHKYWKLAISAINKLNKEQTLEIQMIKAIALIYIIDRVDVLSPTVDTLISIYNGAINNSQAVISALTNLTNNGILRKLEGRDYLKITEYTGKNVETLIADKIAERFPFVVPEQILNQYIGNKVIYPNAYNDDNEIVRYFNFRFINADKIINSFNEQEYLRNIDGDGIVFAIIATESQLVSIRERLQNISEPRVVFIIPNVEGDVLNCIRRYDAIQQLIEKHKEEEILIEELNCSLFALDEVLTSYVDAYLRPELGKSSFISRGEEKVLKRRSALSKLISDICEDVYSRCPIINNEVINKNILTSTAISSRNKLVKGLLNNKLQKDLGLTGTGQDVSFMRSTLCATKILVSENDNITLVLQTGNEKLDNVIGHIKEFIVQTSIGGKRNLKDLYTLLTSPQYHIGLKRGVIPIYFAVVLHYYKKYCVIIKNGKEQEINSLLLDAINNNPEDFDIYLEDWDVSKDNYIRSLEETFASYVEPAEKEYNNFEYIVKAMQRWYLQLPKYVKGITHFYISQGKSEDCDKKIIKFLNSLRSPEINARDYLFNKLIWVFDEEKFSDNIGQYVRQLKRIIDNIKQSLLANLRADLVELFSHGLAHKEATLSSIVLDWSNGLGEEVLSHMFGGSENSMLAVCCNATPDEIKFIEELARVTTGLRIDDWAEITVEGFIKAVKNFVYTVENFSKSIKEVADEPKSGYRITFTDESGHETYRTFNSASYSERAQLMYNDAAAMIDEYGDSLTADQKRQVLIDVINKLLG